MYFSSRLIPRTLFVVLLVGTAFVYLPGIWGGFIFDDYPNILTNERVQITTLSPADILTATISGESGPLGRPLAMFSFAINHYFSGLDPLPYKLTNLTIHLFTGASLWFLTIVLCRAFRKTHQIGPQDQGQKYLALLVTALWILHPFNFMPVLYVVQRMASLSALFTSLGILFYVNGRLRQLDGHTAWQWILASLLTALPLAIAAKETGALLPLYLLVLELTVFGFRTPNQKDKKLLIICYALCIGVPGIIAAIYVFTHPEYILAGYRNRDFTLLERLLTQCRVFLWYLRQTLVPNISEMGLLIDHFQISRNLLSPPSTLAALTAVLTVPLFAFGVRKRLPALTLGIFWFYLGHLLESTILPLEMAYEHRNYLPSFSILFGATFTIFYRSSSAKPTRFAIVLSIAFVSVLAASTHTRAINWNDNHWFLVNEMRHQPKSARIHALLAQRYATLADSLESVSSEHPYFKSAIKHFEESVKFSPNMASSLVALIQLYDTANLPIPADYYGKLIRVLEEAPISASTISSIRGLTLCQIDGTCELDSSTYSSITSALLLNKNLGKRERADILAYTADYFEKGLTNYRAALSLIDNAITVNPKRIGLHLDKLRLLLKLNRRNDALEVINTVERLDTFGKYTDSIYQWRRTLINGNA